MLDTEYNPKQMSQQLLYSIARNKVNKISDDNQSTFYSINIICSQNK
jgi:hypothetical protein